jgi:hypothetical protein
MIDYADFLEYHGVEGLGVQAVHNIGNKTRAFVPEFDSK